MKKAKRFQEKKCVVEARVTTLENEKEIGEVLAKVQKKNLNLDAQLTQDKSNHERLLKEIEKKIK